ncbi:Aldo/keto reductase [Cristinia sonorae]|uniref:Aldo/keto reductase n=1 Tax=Cristinia sonorae TaxID=1940300 RepID=A0A8K0XMA1_9AGAR|nr:Aldo/keto reductase [Cristinia sonorae]
MATETTLETFTLGPFGSVPRIWTGLWQLSGPAWGSAPATKIRAEMVKYAVQGYTAFADHYGSSEVLFGQFRQTLPAEQFTLGATKWCVFQPLVPTPAVVRAVVQERASRLQTQKIDLLQFHWQNYDDKNYLRALQILCQLRYEGVISTIGLCNFDSVRTDVICTELGPGAISTNQVQFSILDTRPLHGMNHVCAKHKLKLLTYGTLCGGFLSDQWLNLPEPDSYSESSNLTPSQRKYLDVILKAWGDWNLFQDLLRVLRVIGDRHGGLSIANIATRWVLDHPFVGAVLIGPSRNSSSPPLARKGTGGKKRSVTDDNFVCIPGARLGLTDHTADNRRVFGFRLTDADRADIQAVSNRSNTSVMITTVGDCGTEYR